MNLIKASVHYLPLRTGEKVKYLRLMYRAGTTTVGSSILARRFSPAFIAKVEAAWGEGDNRAD